ncbi:hypothetical protein Tco_1387557 [Tanacetum coccineum]
MAIRSKEGATVMLSSPSGPPITSVPSQNSKLVPPALPKDMIPENEGIGTTFADGRSRVQKSSVRRKKQDGKLMSTGLASKPGYVSIDILSDAVEGLPERLSPMYP